MAFGDFDLRQAREKLGLTLREDVDMFGGMPPSDLDERMSEVLSIWAPAALAINTEKARSEFIIAPILMEVVRRAGGDVRLFPGVTFDVDKDRGLNGVCDFLMVRSPERYYVNRPVLAVVEAKKEDITGGLGQCLSVMVAARIFNAREPGDPGAVHGAVTTGELWKFLKLEVQTAWIDLPTYHIDRLGHILSILTHVAVGPPS